MQCCVQRLIFRLQAGNKPLHLARRRVTCLHLHSAQTLVSLRQQQCAKLLPGVIRIGNHHISARAVARAQMHRAQRWQQVRGDLLRIPTRRAQEQQPTQRQRRALRSAA